AALPILLAALAVASFALSVWLMRHEGSANAFYMSPPRAWEFLVGAIIAVEGFPVLRNETAQRIARGVAVVVLAIPVFSLRQGPGFPGLNALAPCIGAALFIWSGIGVPARKRAPYSPFHVARFFGQISYSLYLWHWPLFTFARFSKDSLVLDAFDKIVLFALTVAISYLSWRFVELPFRERTLAPTRRAAFATALAASAVLIAGSVGGTMLGQNSGGADRVVAQLETYIPYKFEAIYRSGHCFNPASGVFRDDCLKPAPDRSNVLLWGDSLAAHYFHGLSKAADPRSVNILQGTEAACMPTFNAPAQFLAACRNAATQMTAYFRDHKPDLVILSGDWLEYARPPRFEGMIADLRQTIARLTGSGVRVVLLGPPVQFKGRLPPMLLRQHLRQVTARPDDLLLPDVFSLDARMKAALPADESFAYVSVLDAICPARQCPVTLDGGVPLAWDHAHLTAEGSVLVVQQLLPKLGMEEPSGEETHDRSHQARRDRP
ncbi:acyltransferase family protein, partial [Bradyrhizobium sp.]|uniref:acyltransferase family protein n=1 Tax=Bradyrhizobium sp. TaxID=376 RepID=UPI004037A375